MVLLHVKKGEESQFLFETSVEIDISQLVNDITVIYNGKLKVSRICNEMENLAEHGTYLPPNMLGLTDEQVAELKLVDEWGEKCIPSGGFTQKDDPVGRRNGKAPNEKMQQVLKNTIEEAKAMTSKKQVERGVCLSLSMIQEALELLRGATMIVYPMGLPPHDPIRLEFENAEDLEGTHYSLEVIEICMAQLWFSGKEMLQDKKLKDYVGKNEKTKAVVKLQKRGHGAPSREPVMNEEERKQWMSHAYRRQEELKSDRQTIFS
ncbi:cilia- and flagella-associated protein 298 isoform X2 [Ischnura elegans]|uniref:cilia- and flagella-associated protein 298 isoform X2 n=1 Tax=Ischnura elegans TaxID=197161 RepID=UPI001ED895C8|nr:cilia- and flagella-associated protein 298 isoform X2 [Ischnura elegans]